MPQKSKRIKCTEELVEDFCFTLSSCNESQVDQTIDDFVEDLENVIGTRYFSPRLYVPKSSDWLINILPALDEHRFRRALRVTRTQFQILAATLSQDPIFNKGHQVPMETQLAIALFRFGHSGNGASYVNVASKFGVGDGGTITNVTNRVIQAILKLKSAYVFWPTSEERIELARKLSTKLPGCIGFLDGTHINLHEKPSVLHPEDYFSRKHRYGLHLQVVCDINLKIRQFSVGRTARSHDAYVFNECKLSKQPNSFFGAEEWIAADAAYKLTSTVITPFRRTNGDPDWNQKRKFNKEFSTHRVKVEHSYGILKQKFASLKELRIDIRDNASHRLSCNWIECCLILHNLLLTDDDVNEYDDQELEGDDDDIAGRPNDIEDSEAGEVRRRELLQFIIEKN